MLLPLSRCGLSSALILLALKAAVLHSSQARFFPASLLASAASAKESKRAAAIVKVSCLCSDSLFWPSVSIQMACCAVVIHTRVWRHVQCDHLLATGGKLACACL